MDWWRPPYLASFRAGSFDFVLLAAHVRWGGDEPAARLPELRLLADWVARRTKERFVTDKDLIVVGDFNPAFTHAFTNHGGVLDFYCGDHRPLFPGRALSKREFTYQLSDHLPLWVEISTAVASERVEQVLARGRG